MNLTSKKVLRGLFKKYQIRPSKKLGQNFLIDKKIVQKIIKTVNLGSQDNILEIGPGIGTLTYDLAKKAKKVIAVEKDSKMIEILKETLKDLNNIEIIQGDILSVEDLNLKIKNFKVVGNIPFYLTAPVIRKFLEFKHPSKEMILVVQKEVGKRICAKPPRMSLLAISVQFYAEAKIISYISRGAFWPRPKVDSAIIKIISKKQTNRPAFVDLFFKIVKAGFSQPRKQLINNLSKKLQIDKEKVKNWLLKNDIKPAQRAETLTIKNWLKLTKSFRI